MSFDIAISDQSKKLEDYLKASLYKSLNRKVEKRGKLCVFLLGVGCGISSSLLTIIKQVALIFENIIKGLINIFGCCFIKKASFFRGIEQLIWETPKESTILPFSILSATLGLFSMPYNLTRSPSHYSDKLWLRHDSDEIEARKGAQKKSDFNQAFTTVQQYPTKLEALKKLASYYYKGYGTTQNTKEAIKYYKVAAANGDVYSMKTLGEIYDSLVEEEDRKESLEWFTKAAEAGDVEAMYKMGKLCWGLEGRRREGYDLLMKAAEKDYKPAKKHLNKLERNFLTN